VVSTVEKLDDPALVKQAALLLEVGAIFEPPFPLPGPGIPRTRDYVINRP
jgi:hypothetical protein